MKSITLRCNTKDHQKCSGFIGLRAMGIKCECFCHDKVIEPAVKKEEK